MKNQRRPARYLFLAAILLLLFWLGLKGWRIARAAQSLLARQAQAETLLADGLTGLDPDAAEALVLGVRRDVVTLRDETAVFMPLTPYLTWLPQIGPLMPAAPALMTMADAGTETAVYTLRGLKPALILLQTNQPGPNLLPDLLPILNNAAPDLDAANRSLGKVAAARAQIPDTDRLPAPLPAFIGMMDEWLPLAQNGLALAPHLPAILGADAPRRYLVIAQNADELRPTGGFISGAVLVTVADGRIANLAFLDANYVDAWSDDKRSLRKPYPPPPAPLQTFMGLEMFLFRDANFWPDFPTSAEKISELYSYGQDAPPPDGVIAVDQQFLQLLVQATGPVAIPDAAELLNSANVIATLRQAWAIQDDEAVQDWVFSRKDFIGVFAAAIQAKIETDFAEVDTALLAKNMLRALETKHLQIYLRQPAAALALNRLGWDGRLPTNLQGDFLMAVDANLGYTKANSLITQRIAYAVQIQADGTAQARTTVTYQHAGAATAEPCNQDIRYDRETAVDYATLVNRCYWPYLRIYAPPGSQLTDASRHQVPAEAVLNRQNWDSAAQNVNDLAGFAVFATYLMVPRGQRVESYAAYQLPPIIQTNGGSVYRLTLFKQAGTPPQPVSIAITLPPQAVFGTISPPPTRIEGDTAVFEFALEKDTELVVHFE